MDVWDVGRAYRSGIMVTSLASAGTPGAGRRIVGDVALILALGGLSLAFLAPRVGLYVDYDLWVSATDSEGHWHFLLAGWWAATAVEALALLVRRRLPLAAYVAVVPAAGWHLGDAWFGPSPIDLLAVVTLYSAVLACRGRYSGVLLVGLGAAGGTAIAVAWQHLLIPAVETHAADSAWAAIWAVDVVLPLVGLTPAYLAARARRRELTLLDDQARLLALERDQRAALAAAQERARTKRELHDEIGHGLSVMVIQAQAARGVLNSDPDLAGDVLARVVSVGQGCLDGLRNLLRANPEPADGPALTPSAGLAQLPELLERVRQAGVPVTLHLDPQPSPLPAVVDLAGYRIIQEALTNTIKHTRLGVTASVTIACRGGEGARPLVT